ncbi:MAG: metal-dependent transcriptional regulator [Clostridia bacterium]|nr:metal-dependent transcriptional regulator [Clostridia bacterium]
MVLQESGEMYLETVLILSKTGAPVRATDIGEYRKFSKPSVSRAVGLLSRAGYIVVDKSTGYITLTEEGLSIAEKIYERHNLLSQYLKELGVSPEVADADACRMEHAISDESFLAIKQHFEKNKEK